MTRWMVRAAIGAALLAQVWPGSALAAQAVPYELMFRTGTLDALPRDVELVYDRTASYRMDPSTAEAATGEVHLDFEAGETGRGAGDVAVLDFVQGTGHRRIGKFPAEVGNPLAMYFGETVVAEVARITGGSPFYIRNRIKEALARSAEVTEATALFGDRRIDLTEVTIRPFADDPNRDRMAGFGELAITATLSGDVPGWYRSLQAEVPGSGDAPAWRLSLDLRPAQEEVE